MNFKQLLPFEADLQGKRILVTGHTGFTGGWTCLWLEAIGAEPVGFSLPPETDPSLYDEIGGANRIPEVIGDICNYTLFRDTVRRFQPELILHLAAQPLVRRSYREPARTFEVNVMGTAHVLEAARTVNCVQAVLCITTDKVYKNHEWPWPYRENDPLGGKDPYSASKAAAEMVIQSYSSSFPCSEGKGPLIAAARGGNIIGGGDWSEDRLIPDFVRAVTNKTKLTLRYPDATRPWQHVLALVHGYLVLLAKLISPQNPSDFAKAWNLGPHDPKQYSVRQVLELMSNHWERPELEFMSNPLPEASALALDSSMARNQLGWMPAWGTERVVAETAGWFREYYKNPSGARELTMNQILAWRQEFFQ